MAAAAARVGVTSLGRCRAAAAKHLNRGLTVKRVAGPCPAAGPGRRRGSHSADDSEAAAHHCHSTVPPGPLAAE